MSLVCGPKVYDDNAWCLLRNNCHYDLYDATKTDNSWLLILDCRTIFKYWNYSLSHNLSLNERQRSWNQTFASNYLAFRNAASLKVKGPLHHQISGRSAAYLLV